MQPDVLRRRPRIPKSHVLIGRDDHRVLGGVEDQLAGDLACIEASKLVGRGAVPNDNLETRGAHRKTCRCCVKSYVLWMRFADPFVTHLPTGPLRAPQLDSTGAGHGDLSAGPTVTDCSFTVECPRQSSVRTCMSCTRMAPVACAEASNRPSGENARDVTTSSASSPAVSSAATRSSQRLDPAIARTRIVPSNPCATSSSVTAIGPVHSNWSTGRPVRVSRTRAWPADAVSRWRPLGASRTTMPASAIVRRMAAPRGGIRPHESADLVAVLLRMIQGLNRSANTTRSLCTALPTARPTTAPIAAPGTCASRVGRTMGAFHNQPGCTSPSATKNTQTRAMPRRTNCPVLQSCSRSAGAGADPTYNAPASRARMAGVISCLGGSRIAANASPAVLNGPTDHTKPPTASTLTNSVTRRAATNTANGQPPASGSEPARYRSTSRQSRSRQSNTSRA